MLGMYVVVNQNQIVEAFAAYETNVEDIRQKYPELHILRSDFVILPEEAKSLLRVFDNRIVSKVTAIISTNKEELEADGVDEIGVDIKLSDTQPGEKINTVIVDIDGAEIFVDIQNNKGSLIFSTRVKGLHIITIEDTNIHCCRKAVMGI